VKAAAAAVWPLGHRSFANLPDQQDLKKVAHIQSGPDLLWKRKKLTELLPCATLEGT